MWERAVRISHEADAIEMYFPPLRTPEVALALALFGLGCLTLPLLGLLALLPAGGSAAHGMLVIALFGAFVAPFPVFGTVFIGLAVYMLANSMTVRVGQTTISMTRRLFGLRVSRREVRTEEIADIEPQIAARYQSLFSTEPRFRLIARHASRRKSDMVVAESLKGESAMSGIRDLIVRHTRLKSPRD